MSGEKVKLIRATPEDLKEARRLVESGEMEVVGYDDENSVRAYARRLRRQQKIHGFGWGLKKIVERLNGDE